MTPDNLYTVYDKASLTYAPPFTSRNDATAKRSFAEMTKNHPYKNDMELYYIGRFWADTAQIEMEEKKILIQTEEDNG